MVPILVYLAAMCDLTLLEMAVRLVKIVLVARSCESFVSNGHEYARSEEPHARGPHTTRKRQGLGQGWPK